MIVLRTNYMILRSSLTSSRRNYRTFSAFLPIFKRPVDYLNCKAVVDKTGSYTHGGLLNAARLLAKDISDMLGGRTQERVAYFLAPSAESIIVTWAIWMSGQIAVPLPSDYPDIAHEYVIVDSDSNLIVITNEQRTVGERIKDSTKVPALVVDPALISTAVCRLIPEPTNVEQNVVDDSCYKHLKLADLGLSDTFYKKAIAFIVYTSGTTPKGVVFTHASLHSQAASLVDAWRLSKRDCFLQAVPLKKGFIFMTYLAPLSVGARIVICENLKPENIWIHLLGLRKNKDERPNIIITRSYILRHLIIVYEKKLKKSERMIDHIKTKCMDQIRFFSVGSGPVTRKVFNSWEDITGHQLLSRFSMTETGIVMSMPIYGGKSSSSSVGLPMPGVHVRVTNDSGAIVAEGSRAGTRILTTSQPVTGLLEIRGESILSGYWRKPTTTNEVLSRDGWFKSGDIVKYSRGMYSVLGKVTTDIYTKNELRYSIPLIEAIISDHENVRQIAVIENRLLERTKLMAFVVTDGRMTVNELQNWVEREIPDHPIQVRLVDDIPINWSGEKNRQKILEVYDSQLKEQYLTESEAAKGEIGKTASSSVKKESGPNLATASSPNGGKTI